MLQGVLQYQQLAYVCASFSILVMLTCVEVYGEQEKLPIYETKFNQDTDIWIVGDLRTKLHLQKLSLLHHGYFLNDSHMRASDFWAYLFKRIPHSYTIVDPNFLKVWLEEHLLDKEDKESLLKKQSSNFYIQMMSVLGPLVLSEQGESHMAQYFQANPKSANRWQHWYILSFKIAQLLHLQKKWILSDWIPHLILEILESREIQFEKKKIFVDLGPDLKLVEAQIFKKLSYKYDVYIIEPKYQNQDNQTLFLTQSYRFLDVGKSYTKSRKSLEQKVQNYPEINCLVHATESGQLKNMFEISQNLLKMGFKEDEIVWLFPNLEKALPLLHFLSEQYKQPLIMPKRVKVTSIPAVIKWIQKLKVKNGQFHLSTIEVSPSFSHVPLEQKRKWLRKVSVIEEVPSVFSKVIQETELTNKVFSAYDFVDQIFHEWDNSNDNQILIKVLNTFLSKAEVNTLLTYKNWLRVLEAILPFIEITQDEEEKNQVGIRVLAISEWSLVLPKVIMIGSLVENYFKSGDPVFVQAQDIEAINCDFGYQLNHPHYDIKELDLSWILQSSIEKVYLNGFHLDLKASNHALHPFLINRLESDQLVIPQRHDIHNPFENLADSITITRSEPYRMGVTRFETFAKCSFKFHMENTIKFESINEIDFDLDIKSEGSLNHKIMELMLKNWHCNLSSENVRKELIDRAILESKTTFRNGLELVARQDAEQFYLDFYRYECEFREKHPSVKVLDLELPVECFLDLKEKAFVSQRPHHDQYIFLKGFVDRVDQIGEYFVIVDYKRSIKPDYNFSNWVKYHFYQLYFYGMALSVSCNPRYQSLKWGGAEILSYSDFERKGGFLLSEVIPKYRDNVRSNKDLMTTATIENSLCAVLSSMVEIGLNLLSNNVTLNVEEPFRNLCDYCSWRTICRAPHLM